MPKQEAAELDRVLHQPIRTKIVAYLASHESADFNSIKTMFGLSDGHMTTHMRELLENNYVFSEKCLVDGKIKTIYSITETGRTAFLNYVEMLKKILHFS